MKTISLNPTRVNETTYPNIFRMVSGLGIIQNSDDHKRLINHPQKISPNQVEAVAEIYNDLFIETVTKLQQISEGDVDLDDLLYWNLDDAYTNFASGVLELAYHAGLTYIEP